MDNESILKKKIVSHEALTYDDILLLPNYSDIRRSDVDLTATIHPQLVLPLPVISSPMDTVTESEMAVAMARAGGLGVIHRNMSVGAQSDMVRKVKRAKHEEGGMCAVDGKGAYLVAAAVGVGSDMDERVASLVRAGVDCLVIDSAHGYTSHMIQSVRSVRASHAKLPIMAGNVATFDGAKALVEAGADMLRVGMGPGSICTTRIITGMGVPQISAVSACVRAVSGTKVTVIADGGIRQIGDMAKALAFGAKAVMLGSLLAQYEEAPGEVRDIDGKRYKSYRGMGSVAAMKKGGAERYGQARDTEEKKLIAEGVEAMVEFKGHVRDFLVQIEGSLRSSFYYLGARDIGTFFRTSRAIRISNAGLRESHPHSVLITASGDNYTIAK